MLRGSACFSLIYVISFRLLEIPINVSLFQFVAIEGVVTAVVDLFPRFLRRGYRKELFTAFVCVIWFLIGLSMVTEVIILTYSDSLLRQILTSTVLDQCGEAGYQQNVVKKKIKKFVNCFSTHEALRSSYELVYTCPCVPDRIGIWKCWCLRRGKILSTKDRSYQPSCYEVHRYKRAFSLTWPAPMLI